MNIAITGHTRGVGKFIYEHFKPKANVIGLSRSNGYDINDTSDILDAVKNSDVFINNAYSGYQQVFLLEELYQRWKDLDKIIISIGSVITDYPRIEEELDNDPWPYRDHKLALQKKFRQLVWTPSRCHLVLINLGATDTDLIKHLNCTKLTAKDIIYTVELAFNKIIKEITVYAK